MKKAWVFLVLGIFFISSAFAVVVRLGHEGGDISGLLSNPLAMFAGNSLFGHNNSEIYVNVGGKVETLADALTDGKLINTLPGLSSASYVLPPFGETANNIYVTSKGDDKTLQKAINDGDFLITSWVETIGWSGCSKTACGTTGTQTRTVVCKTQNGTTVGDQYCKLTKPDTTKTCTNNACPRSGKKGRSVICTEFYNQGITSEQTYQLENLYAKEFINLETIKGYHAWAVPFTELLRKSPETVEKIKPLVRGFNEEVLFRLGLRFEGNEIGKLIINEGLPISQRLGSVLGSDNSWYSLYGLKVDSAIDNNYDIFAKEYFSEERFNEALKKAEENSSSEIEFTKNLLIELNNSVNEIMISS